MDDGTKPKAQPSASSSHINGPRMTLEECAVVMGVTRERVRQIEFKAARKLRKLLHEKGLTSIKDFV